jgi:hypothetical protein
MKQMKKLVSSSFRAAEGAGQRIDANDFLAGPRFDEHDVPVPMLGYAGEDVFDQVTTGFYDEHAVTGGYVGTDQLRQQGGLAAAGWPDDVKVMQCAFDGHRDQASAVGRMHAGSDDA